MNNPVAVFRSLWNKLRNNFYTIWRFDRAVRYWWDVDKAVFWRTKEFFGWNAKTGVVVVLWVASALGFVLYRGPEVVREQLIATVAFTLVPLGGAVLIVLGWNLFTTVPDKLAKSHETVEEAPPHTGAIEERLDLWVLARSIYVDTHPGDFGDVEFMRMWALDFDITNRSGRRVSLRLSGDVIEKPEDSKKFINYYQIIKRPDDFDPPLEPGKREPTRVDQPIVLEDGDSVSGINAMLNSFFDIMVPVDDEKINNYRLRMLVTDTAVTGNPTVSVLLPTDRDGAEVTAYRV